MANNNNMSFFETSAKEDLNVTECFYKLTQEILQSATEGENKQEKDRIVLVDNKTKTKKCC
jgi:GTPase SAR1 family protein